MGINVLDQHPRAQQSLKSYGENFVAIVNVELLSAYHGCSVYVWWDAVVTLIHAISIGVTKEQPNMQQDRDSYLHPFGRSDKPFVT